MSSTIAAIATPHGRGAIGIIRISGDSAREIAKTVFSARLDTPRLMMLGNVLDGTQIVDRALGVLFAAPESYTGEDMIELHCHGGNAVLRRVLETVLRAGAVYAAPGEFTKRAFLNNKTDLTRAEAIIDLIDAQTERQAKNAVYQVGGTLFFKVDAIRQTLLELLAEFYAYVDYPDDDIPQSEEQRKTRLLENAQSELSRLVESFETGRILRDGVCCAIVGRPNVGKSSVLNALLGCERSIVTHIPGTTRDTVEETLDLDGVRLELIDTAGVRNTDDPVEARGVERTVSALERADVAVVIIDSSAPLTDEDRRILALTQNRRRIIVKNKSDLPPGLDEELCGACAISAKNNDVSALAEELKRVICAFDIPCDGSVVTNVRHKNALAAARERVLAAMSAPSPDIVATELEAAVNLMGELDGKTASEEILTKIFERFCVGK